MLKKGFSLCLLIALPLVFLFGCGELGKVDQGRVIAFDKDKNLVTIIRDKKIDTLNPDYTYLPPLSYTLPTVAAEIGPLPKAGGRLKLDPEKNQITIFDFRAQDFKTIDFTPIAKKTDVAKDDPLVKDKKFPIIDRAERTITVYSGRRKILETIRVPEEFLFEYPDSTWDAGDEVRIYYKEDGKALRFMNISQTDIFKK